MFYRYEVQEGFDYPHYGIFMAIQDILNEYESLRFTAIFEDELNAPPDWYFKDKLIDFNSEFCFFTQKGNRKFSKAIKKIINALENKGYKVSRILLNENNADILYIDKYQAIIKPKYISESSTTIRKE